MTTNTRDVVERLRNRPANIRGIIDDEAIAEIQRLRDENRKLRRALERIEAMPEKDADTNDQWEIAHAALEGATPQPAAAPTTPCPACGTLNPHDITSSCPESKP